MKNRNDFLMQADYDSMTVYVIACSKLVIFSKKRITHISDGLDRHEGSSNKLMFSELCIFQINFKSSAQSCIS